MKLVIEVRLCWLLSLEERSPLSASTCRTTSSALTAVSLVAVKGTSFGQPDVKIEPILNVFRKKLLLEVGSNEGANHQKYERTEEDAPAVRDRATDQSVVKTVKPPLSLLLDTEFLLLGWSLD